MALESWAPRTVATRVIRTRAVAEIVEDIFDGIDNEQPGLLLELARSGSADQASAAEMARGSEGWSEDELASIGWKCVRDEIWVAVRDYLGWPSTRARSAL